MGILNRLKKILPNRGDEDSRPLQYAFASPPDLDPAGLKALLGGKGAGLASMTASGIPVPQGFTLTTEACRLVGEGASDKVEEAVRDGLAELEGRSGRRLGSTDNPLLLSVRSGAQISMPGMMDTLLNVGMNDEVEDALARQSGDPDFAADAHRRFLVAYSEIVLGVEAAELPMISDESAKPADLRSALTQLGHQVPHDPLEQLTAAVSAVFASWHSPRAVKFREIESIDADLGTACTVQQMVFGNLGADSGTGVAFSRCPSTGENVLTGDFLRGAQGEDVVAGTHETEALPSMAETWPEIHAELEKLSSSLELEYRDLVDVEFTVEQRKLWLLQCRTGKRSPAAAFRVAVDMAEDPNFPLSRDEAVARCRKYLDNPPTEVDQGAALDSDVEIITVGQPASPGLATGVLLTDLDETVERAEKGEVVILVRRETSPKDVHGMSAAAGLLTTLGGTFSHAAVVARAWGVPAVVGAGDLDVQDGGLGYSGGIVPWGAKVTIDGSSGEVMLGDHASQQVEIAEVATIREWSGNGDADDGSALNSEGASSVEVNDVLRIVSLKGAATVDMLAEAMLATTSAVETALSELEAASLAKQAGKFWKAAPAATDHLAGAYPLPSTADQQRFGAILDDRFHEPNMAFKELVTGWQTGGDRASIIKDLRRDIHQQIEPIIKDVTGIAPYLAHYMHRLEQALVALESGDEAYMAHPMKDSYHSVWFELHEDFIVHAGRNRKDEAEAGRA